VKNNPKVNILLVDDQPENLLAVEATLDNPEYNLVKAGSGRAALKCLLQEGDFAVIVLDVKMAGMDGFETASILRQRDRTRHTPIIFLTAHGRDHEQVLQGYSLGAVDYLFKPPEPAILRAKVAVFVELFKKNCELQRQTAQLAAANEELETFCYSVSHDLRGPLRAIDGFASMLREEAAGSLGEKQQDLLRFIGQSAQKMRHRIDDLLSFARMGRAEILTRRVPLNPLVEEVWRDWHFEAQGRNIDWKVTTLPEVEADGDMLRQVFTNLLSNAIKFTRERERAEIEIGCEQGEKGEAVIFVHDNGTGFDMRHANKLFGLFQRLHGEEQFEGTGVGLASVRRIITRHGGRIWAEGEPNQGATFYFSLPKARPADRD